MFRNADVVLAGTLFVVPLATMSACVTWATVKHGFCDSRNAAAPLTWGVAMLVPERIWYPPPGHVLVTNNPVGTVRWN